MQRLVLAILACLLGPTTAALANCNPPPPGLSFKQWSYDCSDEIDYDYQLYGGGMDYGFFVESLYGVYQNPRQRGTNNSGVTPLAACAPDGATQCNASGWLYTCTNGQWLTGSVKCGG